MRQLAQVTPSQLLLESVLTFLILCVYKWQQEMYYSVRRPALWCHTTWCYLQQVLNFYSSPVNLYRINSVHTFSLVGICVYKSWCLASFSSNESMQVGTSLMLATCFYSMALGTSL